MDLIEQLRRVILACEDYNVAKVRCGEIEVSFHPATEIEDEDEVQPVDQEEHVYESPYEELFDTSQVKFNNE